MFMKMMQQQQQLPLGLSLEDMGMEEDAVPFGSLPHEVADDLPVLLSEGEYVVPADVVRYWGLKHLEEMRTQAKCGLMYMEMDGRLQQVDNVDDDAVDADYEDVEVLEISASDMNHDDIDEEMSDLGIDQEEEVDFDGKKPIKMERGGVMGQKAADRKGTVFNVEVDPNVANGFGPPNRSKADVVSDLMSAMNATAKSSTLSADDIATGNITGSKAVASALGFAMSALSPYGALGSVFGKSAQLPGITINGQTITQALGSGVLRGVAQKNMAALYGVAVDIARGLGVKSDLSFKDGQLIGLDRNPKGILGVPETTVVGAVPTDYSVDDYEAARDLGLGLVRGSVPNDPVTGLPDVSKGIGLIGPTVDSVTGATIAGYDPTTGLAQTAYGTSLTGTAAMAAAMTKGQRDTMAALRGQDFDEDAIAAAVAQSAAASRADQDAAALSASVAQDFGANASQISAHNEAVDRGNAPPGSSANSKGGYSTPGPDGYSTNSDGSVMMSSEHDAEKAKGDANKEKEKASIDAVDAALGQQTSSTADEEALAAMTATDEALEGPTATTYGGVPASAVDVDTSAYGSGTAPVSSVETQSLGPFGPTAVGSLSEVDYVDTVDEPTSAPLDTQTFGLALDEPTSAPQTLTAEEEIDYAIDRSQVAALTSPTVDVPSAADLVDNIGGLMADMDAATAQAAADAAQAEADAAAEDAGALGDTSETDNETASQTEQDAEAEFRRGGLMAAA